MAQSVVLSALTMFADIATAPAPDLSDPAVSEFSEQFSLDVSSMDNAQRSAFFAVAGDRAFEIAQQIYVHDMAPRLSAVLTAVLDFDLPAPTHGATSTDLWERIESFMVAVARLDVLDPALTEVVRLRGARLHNCAVCKSRRNVDALDAGATEATFDAIDVWPQSDLAPRTKAALGLVDAMIFTPNDVPQTTIDKARLHLKDDEIVEVLLDVVRNAANKIAVALGADAANVAEGVELFRTDEDGNVNVAST